MAGQVVSAVETDPWGADTDRSSDAAFQPRRYTSYERDQNGADEATFRRYDPRRARFSQPDPYDGSSVLTDPQSFNRYAYTHNDPVNFIDPSGLNAEAGRRCFELVSGYWDGEGNAVITSVEFLGCIGDPATGGGGRGPGDPDTGGGVEPQRQKAAKQDTFNNCRDFVNYLLSLAMLLEIPESGNRHQSSKQMAAERLGMRMMTEAFDYAYITSSGEGFRRELTAYGQNAGVYGHILLQAGAMLEQWGTGTLLSGAFRILDHGQRHVSPNPQRNAEAVAEIEGNKSGRRVGRHMRDFLLKHNDPIKLKADITNELCAN